MFHNKKAILESPEALIRLMITLGVILLIVFPFWDTIYSYVIKPLLNPDSGYIKSFEDFVNNINKMKLEIETFSLKLKEGTVIIGFSKGAERYECYGCLGSNKDKPRVVFNKPTNQECADSACICLCSNGFKLQTDKIENRITYFGQCTKLRCKKIEQYNIIDKVIIRQFAKIHLIVSGETGLYWKNGFLFTNGISTPPNGLGRYNEKISTFVVEKRDNFIGVCNFDMMSYNKEELNSNNCIIRQDVAKK